MVNGAASVVRMSRLVRTNVNALMAQADDPAQLLDRLLRDFSDNIAEADQAVAQTLGTLRLLEDDLRDARSDETEWGEKAAEAVDKAAALRRQGRAAEADRCDEIARVALRRHGRFERSASSLQLQVTEQTQLGDQLRVGLDRLRMKREVLLRNRDDVAHRSSPAETAREPLPRM